MEDHPKMFCNPDTASFLCPALVPMRCTCVLSQDGIMADFSITLQYFTAFERYNELCLQMKHHQRNAESNRKFEKWGGHLTFSQGGGMLVTPIDVSGHWWDLKKKRGEPWDFDIAVSFSPAAVKAYCFLLWMFGSNQPLSETSSLQILACLYLPPSCQEPSSPTPNAFFSPQSLWSPTTCSPFLPPFIALNSFDLSYLYLTLALAPCSGFTLGVACSEHCGVLSTAWSNVAEAWGRLVGGFFPWQLSDVCSSAV